MNLNYLDGSGNTCQWQPTYLGPTLGMAMLPVTPEIVIDVWPSPGWTGTGSAGAWSLHFSRHSSILCGNGHPPTCNELDLSELQRNQAAFDGSISVEDLGSMRARAHRFWWLEPGRRLTQ